MKIITSTWRRLSENDKIHVGVIEAGIFHENDPLIDIPGELDRHSELSFHHSP